MNVFMGLWTPEIWPHNRNRTIITILLFQHDVLLKHGDTKPQNLTKSGLNRNMFTSIQYGNQNNKKCRRMMCQIKTKLISISFILEFNESTAVTSLQFNARNVTKTAENMNGIHFVEFVWVWDVEMWINEMTFELS